MKLLEFRKKKEHSDNREDVHYAAGRISSLAGIISNSLLFAFKLAAGLMSSSAAVITDAFNNLSDCMNSVISLIGARLSEKPADHEHPFGHGRIEYIVSLLMTVFILLFGGELLRTGIERIIHPAEVRVSVTVTVILAVSAAVKFGLYLFNNDLYRKSANTIVQATARDSLNDVMTTSVTLASLYLGRIMPGIPWDGITALFVSLLILKAGLELGYEISGKLIGVPADAETAAGISDMIRSVPGILDVHDLVLHDYGHGRIIGSAHAEMDSRTSLVRAHAAADQAEQVILERCGITMTIHIDPVDVNDPEREQLLSCVRKILSETDESITLHDFRIVKEGEKKEVRFDILLPEELRKKEHEIQEQISVLLKQLGYDTHIVFDNSFVRQEVQ